MKAKKIILASLAIGGSLSVSAQGAADLARSLMQMPLYRADAHFEVLLPSASDPVTYDIYLQSESTEDADSLAACRYVIVWTTATSAGDMSGFSAYFDGNHYRYRNNRLQEYHAAASTGAFLPQGPGSQRMGVQNTAQFADLLPQMLGVKMAEIASDTTYIYTLHADTLVSGKRSVVIDGVKRGDGYDVQRFSYVFDHDTLMPVMSEIETNPGSISEQILTVTYAQPTTDAIDISEEGLMEHWPDVFDKYRQSTFKAENLVNTALPSFSCQMLGGSDRYAHHGDEKLASTILIVFLDPQVATTSETVAAIREAVDNAPKGIDVIWVFGDNDTQAASMAVAPLRTGETALVSANSLSRNCGITLYPTTIIVDRDAIVREVIPGYNNDLPMVVLQKVMLVK